MARWPRGEAEIERLLSLKHLQALTGAAANGRPLLDKAHRTLSTAASIASTDPDSAFVLAYDAARYATTALLAQQGLRPTTSGGHVAVESAIRAQFGDGFRNFGFLRRASQRTRVPERRLHHLRHRRGKRRSGPVLQHHRSGSPAPAEPQLLPNPSFFG